jgi:hypothetical protein
MNKIPILFENYQIMGNFSNLIASFGKGKRIDLNFTKKKDQPGPGQY